MPSDDHCRVRRSLFRAVSVIALALAAGSCALPAAGPTVDQVQYQTGSVNFALVRVDKRVATILHRSRRNSLALVLRNQHYVANNVLHPGDAIAITIYESGTATMFTPPNTPQPQPAPSLPATQGPGAPAPTITPSGVTTIPPQVIESDGTVNIPFSGRINVIGKTPGAVAKEVEKQLEGKAARPQVIVTLVGNATNTATVGGEVNSPRLVALSLRGERLLDVIAAAGGAKYPAYETFVNVVREGRVGSVLLQTLITNPKENVTVGPNDQIFLTRSPRTFAVLGAAQKVSQYTFDTERVTLAEAVARAGGPIDTIGDPSGVYLFRYEPIGVLQEIGGPRMLNGVDIVDRRFVPVLYRIAFNESDGYFLSQAIELRDKDVVLITNSEVTQMQKVLAVVRGVTGVAYDLSRGSN